MRCLLIICADFPSALRDTKGVSASCHRLAKLLHRSASAQSAAGMVLREVPCPGAASNLVLAPSTPNVAATPAKPHRDGSRSGEKRSCSREKCTCCRYPRSRTCHPEGGSTRGSTGLLTELVVMAWTKLLCWNCARRAKLLIKVPAMRCWRGDKSRSTP